jgi:hypothetical protein
LDLRRKGVPSTLPLDRFSLCAISQPTLLDLNGPGSYYFRDIRKFGPYHLHFTLCPRKIQSNWKVWIPVQLLNFTAVPLQLRVLVANTAAVGWNAYLSYASHRANA